MSQPELGRARLEAKIDLRHPLAGLGQRMDWAKLEAALAPRLERATSVAQAREGVDLFGPWPDLEVARSVRRVGRACRCEC